MESGEEKIENLDTTETKTERSGLRSVLADRFDNMARNLKASQLDYRRLSRELLAEAVVKPGESSIKAQPRILVNVPAGMLLGLNSVFSGAGGELTGFIRDRLQPRLTSKF